MSIVTLLRPEHTAQTARVRSSACRGYIVELEPDSEGPTRMLERLTGNAVHFRSLDRVRDGRVSTGLRSKRKALLCEVRTTQIYDLGPAIQS